MYAIRNRGMHAVLVEITAKEFKKPPEGVTYRKVDACAAHNWVRRNHIHETGLWIDFDGKIRKAQKGV